MAQFSTLISLIDDNKEDQQLLDEAKQEMQQHLDDLVHSLDCYFPERETVLVSGASSYFQRIKTRFWMMVFQKERVD